MEGVTRGGGEGGWGREGLRASSGQAALSCCIPGEHGGKHSLLTKLGCAARLGLGQRQDQTPRIWEGGGGLGSRPARNWPHHLRVQVTWAGTESRFLLRDQVSGAQAATLLLLGWTLTCEASCRDTWESPGPGLLPWLQGRDSRTRLFSAPPFPSPTTGRKTPWGW